MKEGLTDWPSDHLTVWPSDQLTDQCNSFEIDHENKTEQCHHSGRKKFITGLEFAMGGFIRTFHWPNRQTVVGPKSKPNRQNPSQTGKLLSDQNPSQTYRCISPAVDRTNKVYLQMALWTDLWSASSIDTHDLSSLTYHPSTTTQLCRHVLDWTRKGIK